MELITPDYTLLVMIAIFLLTYAVVKRWLVDPINGVLEWRAAQVHEADSKYEDAMATLHESSSESEAKLQSARREAAEVRDRYRGEATREREEKMSAVRADAEKQIAQASEELDREVGQIRGAIETDAEKLAEEMAERVLGRDLR